MIHKNLRKGITTIEIYYEYGTETINAIETFVELNDNYILISTRLKPVDSNQEDDANSIFTNYEDSISKILLNDKRIIEGLKSFFKNYEDRANFIQLEIHYKKIYSYQISIEPYSDEKIVFELLKT